MERKTLAATPRKVENIGFSYHGMKSFKMQKQKQSEAEHVLEISILCLCSVRLRLKEKHVLGEHPLPMPH